MRHFRKVIALSTMLTMLITTFTGCDNGYSDVMTDMQKKEVFAVNYFKLACETEEYSVNTVVSPMLAMMQIGMLSNGLSGNTLESVSRLLGDESGHTVLNIDNAHIVGLASEGYLDFRNNIVINSNIKLGNASSIFYSNCMNIYKANMINSDLSNKHNMDVVRDQTGLICYNSDQIVLESELYFNSQWSTYVSPEGVTNEQFINSDGNKSNVEYIFDNEADFYIDGEKENVVMEFIGDGSVAIAFIMPKDSNYNIDSYIDDRMTADTVNMLLNSKDYSVKTAAAYIPSFQVNMSIDNKTELFSDLGLGALFENSSDFKDIVDTDGESEYAEASITRLTDAVKIKVRKPSESNKYAYETDVPDDSEIIKFNRPFVYMVVDTSTNFPLVIGKLDNIESK
jgi:serpin B